MTGADPRPRGTDHTRPLSAANQPAVGAVVILVALLLLPFRARFAGLTPVQIDAYLVATVAAAASVGCLVATTLARRVHHGCRGECRLSALPTIGSLLLGLAALLVLYLAFAVALRPA